MLSVTRDLCLSAGVIAAARSRPPSGPLLCRATGIPARGFRSVQRKSTPLVNPRRVIDQARRGDAHSGGLDHRADHPQRATVRRSREWGKQAMHMRFLLEEPARRGGGLAATPPCPFSGNRLKVGEGGADRRSTGLLGLGTDGNHNRLRSFEKGRRTTPPFSLRKSGNRLAAIPARATSRPLYWVPERTDSSGCEVDCLSTTDSAVSWGAPTRRPPAGSLPPSTSCGACRARTR